MRKLCLIIQQKDVSSETRLKINYVTGKTLFQSEDSFNVLQVEIYILK